MRYVKTFESFVGEKYIMQELEDELGIVLDLWDNGDHFELGKIEVPKDSRGSGVGTKAMEKIIARADKEGKDIRLTPSTDFGASSVNRLKRFYSQFGFVKNTDLKYKDTMVRYAQ